MSNVISGILLQRVKRHWECCFSILAEGPIVSSHCVPVKANRRGKCEPVCGETPQPGFRGRTGSGGCFVCLFLMDVPARVTCAGVLRKDTLDYS